MKEKIAAYIEQVRNCNPLVHHITNYVSANDCATITLAVGASPIMADAIEEIEEITAHSSALVLNIGTVTNRTLASMLAAGKTANENHLPIIFDPVGVGISTLRKNAATSILSEIKPAVLRGNYSEIGFLAGNSSQGKGVDSSANIPTQPEIENTCLLLAQRYQCVVAATGPIDVVSDGTKIISSENGHPMLRNLTGTGCMCASLIGSFCGAVKSPFEATIAALLTMNIAGEIAFEHAGYKGNGSFRVALFDAVSQLNSATITERAVLDETKC